MAIGLAAALVLTGVGYSGGVLDDTARAIDANLYVAPGGSDASACTKSAPCASFDRAYRVASPGQVVGVAAGTYPSQEIASVASRRALSPPCSVANRTHCVVFRPTSGTVTVNGNLVVRASNVYLLGSVRPAGGVPRRGRIYDFVVGNVTQAEATDERVRASHVVFENIKTRNFGAFSSDHITFRGLDVGPSTDDWAGYCTAQENKIGRGAGLPPDPSFITIERSLIHNQNRTLAAAQNDCHTGGLFVVSGGPITIRDSVFSQNVVYNIQLQNFGGSPPPHRVTIENTWFGCPVENLYVPNGETTCDRQADIQFSAASRFESVLIRHNSLAGGIGIYTEGASFANARIVGNVGAGSGRCLPGVAYAYNAWRSGARCSPSDIGLGRSPFVAADVGREDFTLVRGTPALGLVKGSGSDFGPVRDIEGRMRPVRAGADAGATQRESAAIVLGGSIGATRLGAKRDDVLELFGRPRKTSTRSGVRRDTFRAHGSTLRVAYQDDRVVEISTTSGYYTTTRGFGRGSAASDAPRLARLRWDACRGVYRRRVGSGVVYAKTNKAGKKVTAITILRRSFEEPCAS